MKRIILLVCALAFAPAFANTHAQNLVDALNNAAPDSLTCSVKSKSKTIMCIVNVDAGYWIRWRITLSSRLIAWIFRLRVGRLRW